MARSFKQRGTVVVPLAESPVPMVEVESTDNPASFSETVAGEGNITGLIVYGKSTQDGTPSPENPVPIVSAGEGGSVEVLVTGKNLLDISKMRQTTKNGITFSLENGGIKISGTATADTDSPIFTFRLPAGTYISNINIPSFPWLLSVSYLVERGGSPLYLSASRAFTILDGDVGKYFYFGIRKEETVNEIIYPQLEVGSTATPYEPYKSQSLTISTPNSLPGIPVDSGGNYTDASGQQWLANYRDWGRGVDVQMCCNVVLDGTTGGGFDNNGTWHMDEEAQKELFGGTLIFKQGFKEAFSDRFEVQAYNYTTAKTQTFYVSETGNECSMSASFFETPSIDGFKAYFKANPTRFVVPYTESIETPIPADELAAYRALHTYDGTTVISANSDPIAPGLKTKVKIIDPNSDNPQVMRL